MTATREIDACLWPLAERDELAARLAQAAGISAAGIGERFEVSYADVAPALGPRVRAEIPAILRIGAAGGAWLAVLEYGRAHARALARDGTIVALPLSDFAAYLRAPVEQHGMDDVGRAVAGAGLAGPRAAHVSSALAVALFGSERVAEGTRLRPPARSFTGALRSAHAASGAAGVVAGTVVELALLIVLWRLLGRAAVAHRPLAMWPAVTALVAALVVCHWASAWAAGRFALDFGAALRERMLNGILALDPEVTRQDGIGRLMGRVVDAEAIEMLALGGGLSLATGAFELSAGVVVLALGLTPAAHLVLVAVWLGAAALFGTQAYRRFARWSGARLALTHDLVERMVGQRTLVAQQPPELRRAEDDHAFADYARVGRRTDRALVRLAVGLPRGFLIAALAVLATRLPDIAARPGAFAASLGGALFVYAAARRLAYAFPSLCAALVAARNVRVLFETAAPSAPPAAAASPANAPPPTAADPPVFAARDLVYRYPGRPTAVLDGCGFEIRRGDRVLIESPSGAGKSTLAAVMCGLRTPTSGRMTTLGIDQATLGLARWRARIGAAPQFHDNHVFSDSLLYNLLIGRAWPPRHEDVALAEAICGELGLGPLLARMPSGLGQLVGESGWQLSHGERARLYVARALLQPLELRVLDESFAPLDPETLETALRCVLARAETLVVIAHA
jgi:ABC-type multidrug transport system fused ATPase/permease subunit